MKTVIVALSLVVVCFAQRPSYAGSRAIGYPEMNIPTPRTTVAAAINGNPLGDRFGVQSTVPPTTQRMPLEANGDANLVNRLSQLPVDQQPFWLINWKALDELRNQPHSYPIQQNQFVDFASSPHRQNGF